MDTRLVIQFDGSVCGFVEAVERFELQINRLAQLMGMQSENDRRKAVGLSMTYVEEDFINV
jgi:hypothetical protein